MYRFLPLFFALACSAPAPKSTPAPKPPARPSQPTAAPIRAHAPALARLLSAEHTVGYIGLEQLDAVVRSFDANVEAFSAQARAQMPAFLTDPAQRQARLGFDPATAKGWLEGAGIDPSMGIGFAFDTRFSGPLLYARIARPLKLLNALRRLGLTIEMFESDNDRFLPIIVNGEPWAIVRFKDHAVAFQTLYSSPSMALVDASLASPTAVLADDARFKTAMADVQTMPWLSGYFNTATVVAPLVEMGDAPRFYAERYPALALAINAETVVLRLLTDETARTALGQIFKTTGVAPGFSRFLSPDRMTVRLGLQFDTILNGASALFSPTSPMRDTFRQWRAELTTLTAVTPERLAGALDGHVAVETPTDGDGMPLILAGIRNPTRVDALLSQGAAKLQSQGIIVSKTQAEGRVTYTMRFGSQPVAVTRTATTVLIGPPAAVNAAMARTKSDLPPAIAAKIDQPTLMTAVVPINATEGTDPNGFSTATFARLWSGNLIGNHVVSEVQLDDRGLLFSDHFSLMAAAGFFAAIAVPAYMKYTRRSRAEEGRRALRALVAKAFEVADRDGRFPKSIPRTPAKGACKDGKPWRQRIFDVEGWAHPGWQALGFSDDFSLFQFEFVSDGRSFTARAKGDLDCDGVFSTFEQTGRLGEKKPRPMTVHQLLE